MYLYELVNWLTTVVDSLQISDVHKDEAYHAAAAYIAQCLMVRYQPSRRLYTRPAPNDKPFILKDSLTDRNTAMMNENAMANVLVDVDFLEEQFRGAGRAGLVTLFSELRAVRCRPSSHHYRSSHTLDFLKPLTPSSPADNIDRPLRFRRRIPRTIAAPDDVRPSQTKETHCGTREAGTLWRKLSRPTIP